MLIYIVGAAVIYLISSKYFKDFNPGDKRINSDIGQLKSEIADLSAGLVPWNNEEAELLSLLHTQKTRKIGMGRQVKGQFKSIYQEPMIAYAYKEYPGGKGEKLLLIRSGSHELVYRIKQEIAQIYYNTAPLGTLHKGESLYELGSNKLIGKAPAPETDLWPIQVGGRRIASIQASGKNQGPNPRAFSYLIPWTPEEEPVFLALALYRLVMLHLPRK